MDENHYRYFTISSNKYPFTNLYPIHCINGTPTYTTSSTNTNLTTKRATIIVRWYKPTKLLTKSLFSQSFFFQFA